MDCGGLFIKSLILPNMRYFLSAYYQKNTLRLRCNMYYSLYIISISCNNFKITIPRYT